MKVRETFPSWRAVLRVRNITCGSRSEKNPITNDSKFNLQILTMLTVFLQNRFLPSNSTKSAEIYQEKLGKILKFHKVWNNVPMILYNLKAAAKWASHCRNRRRYSRERASETSEMNRTIQKAPDGDIRKTFVIEGLVVSLALSQVTCTAIRAVERGGSTRASNHEIDHY